MSRVINRNFLSRVDDLSANDPLHPGTRFVAVIHTLHADHVSYGVWDRGLVRWVRDGKGNDLILKARVPALAAAREMHNRVAALAA